jgi:UDP-galactopyranose mutase
VRALADAHPRWQIVLVGPVAGIDPSSLPRRPNIHYLGPQPYRDLPRFLAGWDVGLLPFARHPATRFIDPAATLEYMAAELPVVSTPAADIVECYGDVVAVAHGTCAFIAACEQALLAAPAERAALVEKMRKRVNATSWDATVTQLRALLDAATPPGAATRSADDTQLVPGTMQGALGGALLNAGGFRPG